MNIWAVIIYVVCLVASVVCAALLARSFHRYRSRILLWSSVSFTLLALNNLMMVLDLLVFPEIDLSVIRTCCSLAAACTLIYGFIWELS